MLTETAQKIAAVYDARAEIPFDGHSNQKEVKAAVNWVSSYQSELTSRICDVGCNAGWHLEELHARGYRMLTGIDLSSKALSIGANRMGGLARLILGDVAIWGVDEFFDVATNFNSCLGTDDRAQDIRFLSGIRRILKVNGLLFITFMTTENAVQRLGEFNVRYELHSNQQLRSIVKVESTTGEIIIEQQMGYKFLPVERFRPYSDNEVTELLRQLKFEIVVASRDAFSTPDALDLSFVSGIVARKRS